LRQTEAVREKQRGQRERASHLLAEAAAAVEQTGGQDWGGYAQKIRELQREFEYFAFER